MTAVVLQYAVVLTAGTGEQLSADIAPLPLSPRDPPLQLVPNETVGTGHQPCKQHPT